jgi:hypothetical protein
MMRCVQKSVPPERRIKAMANPGSIPLNTPVDPLTPRALTRYSLMNLHVFTGSEVRTGKFNSMGRMTMKPMPGVRANYE